MLLNYWQTSDYKFQYSKNDGMPSLCLSKFFYFPMTEYLSICQIFNKRIKTQNIKR
jgi:hypothetical protein